MKISTNTCQSSNLDLSYSLRNRKKTQCLFSLWLLPGTRNQPVVFNKETYVFVTGSFEWSTAQNKKQIRATSAITRGEV